MSTLSQDSSCIGARSISWRAAIHFYNRALVQELAPASLYFKPEGNQESYEGQHTLAFVITALTERGLPVCHLLLLVLHC